MRALAALVAAFSLFAASANIIEGGTHVIPALWMADAQCETGHNPPNWRFHAGPYEGGIAFASSTWRWWARETGWYPRYEHAYQAPGWVQARVAQHGLTRYGRWGCLYKDWVWSKR